MFMEKCLVCSVLVLVAAISYTESVNVAGTCSNSAMCPMNSTCTQRGCDGKVCICDEGFSPLDDLTACKIAVELDDFCGGDEKICKAANAHCDSDTHVCVCNSGFIPASGNLRCKPKPIGSYEFALLGETCGAVTPTCFGTFERCDLSLTYPKCDCYPGFRPATDEEKNAEPFITMECRPDGYNLTLPRSELECIDPPPVHSIIDEACVTDNNCPDDSVCRPRGCDGKVCVCDTGYYPTPDRTSCHESVDLGGSCSSNTTICKHEGLYTQCNNTSKVCECLNGFEADQQSCRPVPEVFTTGTVIRKVFLGESCRTVQWGDIFYVFPCFDPLATCISDVCKCYPGLRLRSDAEVALYPTADSECLPSDFTPVVNTEDCHLPEVPQTTPGHTPGL